MASNLQGIKMFELAKRLWPLNRSLSGSGVRETLDEISWALPDLAQNSLRSGDKKGDWIVPLEWSVGEAWIKTPAGEKICDYSQNNLHLMGYSEPINGFFTLQELEDHLHSLPSQPDAIPYVTSYYKKNWGFCITQEQRDALAPGRYEVFIDSTLESGQLDYGELVIKGKSDKQVLFSTYICHPSMANNEFSGPVLAVELAKFVNSTKPFYTYKVLFLPETIGAISYIEEHVEDMKRKVIAGFVLTCVGDNRTYSYVPSRLGDSLADLLALETSKKLNISMKRYSWKDRGSDERQYCWPGVDLPVCSVMRSKYGEYHEYHTSLDTLGGVVTPEGLQGSFDFYKQLVETVEARRYPSVTTAGEPNLGSRGLYPTTSVKGSATNFRFLLDFLSTCDGKKDLDQIKEELDLSSSELEDIVKKCLDNSLVSF